MFGNIISELKSSIYMLVRMVARSEIGKTIARELAKMGIRFGEIITISHVFDAMFRTYSNAEALLTNMFAGYADKDIEKLKNTEAWKKAEGFIKFLYNFNRAGADFVNTCWAIDPSLAGPAGRLFSALSWAYGYGWLSWVAMSPILSHEIADELNDELTYIKRPRALSQTVADALAMRYPDLTLWWINYMQRRGYNDEDIKRYAKYLTEIKYKEEKDLTKSEILRLYRENIIDRTTAKDMLISLGYDENEAELLLSLEDLKIEAEKAKEVKVLTKYDVLRAYRENVIGREEAKAMLLDLGYSKEDAELLLKIEDIKKKAKESEKERELSKSDLLRLYREGVIDRKTAKEALMDIGYSESDAELLLRLEDIKKKKKS